METKLLWQDRIARSIVQVLNVQLSLSLVTLPMLMAWGLPISIVTLVATPLFAPFLSLFLFLSSFIFCALHLGLNPSFFVIFLDWITDFWLFLLSFSSPDWLFGFVMLQPFPLAILAISNFLLMLKSITWQPHFRLCILTGYICILILHLLGLSVL